MTSQELKEKIMECGGFKKHCSTFPMVEKNTPYSFLTCLKENIGREPLLEALIKSYPVEKVFSAIVEKFSMTTNYGEYVENPVKFGGFAAIVDLDNGEKGIQVFFENIVVLNNRILQLMSCCGYHVAAEEVYDEGIKTVLFYKTHEDKIQDIVEKYKYLYHVTLASKEEKIKKNGLIPKENNDGTKKGNMHPSRVYLYPFKMKPSIYVLFNIGKMLYPQEKFQNFNYQSFNDFIAVEILTEDIKDKKFFYDPDMANAVYTTDNIPPDKIDNVFPIIISF